MLNPELKEKVNKYIEETLLKTNDLPTTVVTGKKEEIVKEIIARLFARRFRKYAISEDVKINLTEKLENIVKKQLPLTFIPSFGGYKHWWAPTYPEVDWAEVFNMKFLLHYLAPIFNSSLSVSIEYESEEVILSELNNVPQEGLDAYTKTFRLLAEHFNRELDGRTTIGLTLARDLYDVDRLHEIIEETFSAHEEAFDNYAPEDQTRRLKKVETNFLLDGVTDYSNFSEEEKLALYKHSRVLNETFLDADFELRPNYFEGESSIPLLFSFGLGPGGENWLHIGSCATSMVDFWAGMGILEYWKEENRFIQRIISRTQYEQLKESLIRVPVISKISNISKNFEYIYVYEGKLVF